MENEPSRHSEGFLSLLALLGQDLNLQQPTPPDLIGRPAAVVCPLVLPHWDCAQSEASLLYIKRSANLRKHSGQMAFPGGAAEAGEDLLTAGFREGQEEVGLRREQSRLIATLPASSTPTGFRLQPFLIATTQSAFQAQPEEVESIHLITLEELMQCPVRLEHREWLGVTYRVIYFDTSTVCIWGVTGRITEIILRHFFDWSPPDE